MPALAIVQSSPSRRKTCRPGSPLTAPCESASRSSTSEQRLDTAPSWAISSGGVDVATAFGAEAGEGDDSMLPSGRHDERDSEGLEGGAVERVELPGVGKERPVAPLERAHEQRVDLEASGCRPTPREDGHEARLVAHVDGDRLGLAHISPAAPAPITTMSAVSCIRAMVR